MPMFLFLLQFCQPQGWRLSSQQQPPSFFASVLTDMDANRHYCACLCFNEPIAIQPIKQADDEDLYLDDLEVVEDQFQTSNNSHHSIMYAPKCLVLVSKHHHIENLKVRRLLHKHGRRKGPLTF